MPDQNEARARRARVRAWMTEHRGRDPREDEVDKMLRRIKDRARRSGIGPVTGPATAALIAAEADLMDDDRRETRLRRIEALEKSPRRRRGEDDDELAARAEANWAEAAVIRRVMDREFYEDWRISPHETEFSPWKRLEGALPPLDDDTDRAYREVDAAIDAVIDAYAAIEADLIPRLVEAARGLPYVVEKTTDFLFGDPFDRVLNCPADARFTARGLKADLHELARHEDGDVPERVVDRAMRKIERLGP